MRRAFQFVAFGFSLLVTQPRMRAQVSFSTVADMALRNSPRVRMAAADVQHAEAAVSEGIAAYKPSFSVGSSLGYSYGFPVGQPSIYNVNANSLAFSFSQPDYIRSARKALEASQLQLKDARQQVILSAALDYIQLSTVDLQVAALDQQTGFVDKLVAIENERVTAGVDRKVEVTQARLTGAQVALRRLHLVDQGDLLRAQLAHLTGLKPTDLVTDPRSVPPPPSAFDPAEALSSGVQSAYASAKSKLYTAFGDAKQNNRPTLAFGLEYNRYAKFNNYNEYYLRFQHNNFNVGVQITLPLFDAKRTAQARASGAEAAQAAAQADQSRDQAEEQVLQLRKSIEELSAQERVAALQSELSQDQLETVTDQLQSGSGNPNAPAPLPKDEQAAHIGERSRYVDMLETQFQLIQARLSLLRALGRIEDWAKTPPSPHP